MKVLDIKSFLKINEAYKTYNIEVISNPAEIKQKLVYIANESEKHPLYCETNAYFNSLERNENAKSKELTHLLASLDINYELIQDKEIQKLLSKILFNTLKSYFYDELDNVWIENEDKDWEDNYPEQGNWVAVYDFNYELDDILPNVSGEQLNLRTYNLSLYYDNESGEPTAYCDGYTPNGEDLTYEFPDEEIVLESDNDFYDEFDSMYDEHCKECKCDYEPNHRYRY